MNLTALPNRPAVRPGQTSRASGAARAAPEAAVDTPGRGAPRDRHPTPGVPVPWPRLSMGPVDGWAGVEFDGGCPQDRAAW